MCLYPLTNKHSEKFKRSQVTFDLFLSGHTKRKSMLMERLIASGLIDDVVERFTYKIAAQVFGEDSGRPVVIGRSETGDMGADKDVGQVPEGTLGRQWLLLEDIQSSSGDLSLTQSM